MGPCLLLVKSVNNHDTGDGHPQSKETPPKTYGENPPQGKAHVHQKFNGTLPTVP